jgi:hypothetical protein
MTVDGPGEQGIMKSVTVVISVLLAGCLVLVTSRAASAAEGGVGIYRLGSNGGMGVGILPPPGLYLTDTIFFYSGSISKPVDLNGTVELQANVTVLGDSVSLLNVTNMKLFGSNYAFGISLPIIGNANLTAEARTGGLSLGVTRGSSTATGDLAVVPLMLGWQGGNLHYKFSTVVFVPTGQYNLNQLVNIGSNHWADDSEFSVTWLNPKNGFEATASLGYTVNFLNPATGYQTGNEAHVEYVLAKHFPSGWAVGLGGYYYSQVTGDSGPGALLGAYEGQASALGPQFAYFGNLGDTPYSVSVRWYHEFNVVNRFQGDAYLLTGNFHL